MKIGIVTHYYGSYNYGGVLQAYALVKVLNKMGYDAEQICFPYKQCSVLDKNQIYEENCQECIEEKTEQKRKRSLQRRVLSKVKRVAYNRTIGRIERKQREERQNYIEENYFSPRRKAFDEFRMRIPHSPVEYSSNALFMANDRYDGFITGSDQVWNLIWHNTGFFLEFADSNKKKIAYAASAGASEFDEVQKKYLQRVLPEFDAISVRESDLVNTYREIAGVESEWVLDPTLLIEKTDWDEIASQRIVQGNYLLFFFYNPAEKHYKLAEEYAQKHNLKIVTIPFSLFDRDMRLEDNFGDYRVGAASPEDFISLVKYAECVFTDSFHCNVFSLVYQRPFFTFTRQISDIKSSSRISTLLEMFGCCNRYCDSKTKQSMEYLETIQNSIYSVTEYEKMKNKSLEFLKKI